jgi:hypothetical protein
MASSPHHFVFESGQPRKIRSFTAAIPVPAFGSVANAFIFASLSTLFINLLHLASEGRNLITRWRRPGGKVGIFRLDDLAYKDPNHTLTARVIGAIVPFHLGEAAQPERDARYSLQGKPRCSAAVSLRAPGNRMARSSKSPAKVLSDFQM